MTGTTTSSQSGPGSNSTEEALQIPQSSRNGASSCDAVWCHAQENRWVGAGPSAKTQSVYFKAPAGKAGNCEQNYYYVTWNHILEYKLFVLDRNTWYLKFILVSLFNGISTSKGYLMPKPSLYLFVCLCFIAYQPF